MLGYMRCPSKVQTNSYLQRVSMEVVDNVYKMLEYFRSPPEDQINVYPDRVVIYECAFQTLRFIDTPDEDMPMSETTKSSHVSLNGNLYWIACNRQTREYFIQSSDFSSEIFKPVCLLSFQESPSCDEHVLAVFKGDRFSLLMQSYLTRKIEIWVTKRKIDDTEEMVWMKLMTLTATNLPKLFNKLYGVSYFIYDKTLVMCCGDDESGKPCIYIVKGDTCNKIHIGADLNSLASRITWFSHCAYVPNWTSVPLEF
ncbi:protein SUPPRESSOR OF NIM1 1-like [Brassica napus]|uniref:protein SUPPRESSOR OF NIM1 1-like n=1 Tax=Brassica napus TaxID=3708 RepID=UPI0006AB7491|nr:protein SUPPRESSOR OF NIM1 1-like [Brassica napus]